MNSNMLKKKKLIRTTTIPITFQEILSGQLKYVQENSEFDVIAVSAGGKVFQNVLKENNVRGYEVPFTRKTFSLWSDFVAFIKLIKIFHKEKPFIVHSQGSKDALLCMIAGCICRVPHRLYTIAGLGDLSGIRGLMLRIAEWVTFFFSTKLYPNSVNMNKIYLARGMYKASKAKVIGFGSSNGCDIDKFSLSNISKNEIEEVKKSYDINTGITFCFVGRIVGDKGINELVRAFKRLCESNDCHLIIVGRFEKDLYQDIFPDVADNLAENPRIHLTGYQSDVRKYIAASDALILPSYREGMPNVVMQACAMNRPCIVTNINGCNEIIENGVNGSIIESHSESQLFDAMKYYCDNPDVIKKMGQVAREIIASKFAKKEFLKLLVDEYNSLS